MIGSNSDAQEHDEQSSKYGQSMPCFSNICMLGLSFVRRSSATCRVVPKNNKSKHRTGILTFRVGRVCKFSSKSQGAEKRMHVRHEMCTARLKQ